MVTESGGSPKVSSQQTGVPGKPWLEFPPLSASFALEGTHHKGGPLGSQSQSGRATLWPQKGVVRIIHIKARQEAENKARTPRGHSHEDPPPTDLLLPARSQLLKVAQAPGRALVAEVPNKHMGLRRCSSQ